MTYSARNHSINRSMRAAMVSTVSLQAYAVAGLALFFAGAAIGYSLPMGKPATYELVAIQANGDSDVVDYGLTATDCGESAALARSIQPAAAFECAPKINR